MTRQLKLGTSSVRGIVGAAFHPELVVKFASAFGTWIDGGAAALGRDTRRSSPMVHHAVVSGLLAAGCRIVDLGVTPTPLTSFAVRELGCDGGISITGGHNDSSWNALKFIGADGCLLNSARSEELFDIYHASSFRCDVAGGRRTSAPIDQVTSTYLECLTSAVDREAISDRGLRIAIDFCGGTAYPLAEPYLQRLGCVLFPINPTGEAEFPHPPAPTRSNMEQLRAAVLSENVHLGACVNVDGDRIAFVTGSGICLSEEMTLPLSTRARFLRRPGPVVTNYSTAGSVEELAARQGQPVYRTMVGESYVIDKAMEEGAVIAGEGSGGVAFLPLAATFDALLTLGLVLEMLSTSNLSLDAIVAELPVREMRKGEIRCSPSRAYAAMDALSGLYPEASTDFTDGIRKAWEGAWLHVRVSRTEPLLRVIAEAASAEEVDAIFGETMARVKELLKGNGD